jgi:hypothetical protein
MKRETSAPTLLGVEAMTKVGQKTPLATDMTAAMLGPPKIDEKGRRCRYIFRQVHPLDLLANVWPTPTFT